MSKNFLRGMVFSILLITVFAFSAFSYAEWKSLEENAKPYQGTILRLIGESLSPLEGLAQVKHVFEEATGITVEIEGYGHQEVIEKTTADFVGKTGIYNIVLNPHQEIGKLVTNNWIEPLEKFANNPDLRDPNFNWDEIFLNKYWFQEICTYKDTVYGFPFHFISMYMWYRYDLFENTEEKEAFKTKYGYELPSPPITTKEYLDTAEFFTRKAGEKLAGVVLTENFYGTAIQAAPHVSTWYGYLNFLYSFGGRELIIDRGSDYGKVVLNSPEAVEALEYYKKLVDYCPPGVMTYGWNETQAASQQGICAQAIQWDDATYAVEDPKQSKVAGKMAFSGVPINKVKQTQVAGWAMFIPTSSEKQEAAWLFLQWCMGADAQVAQMLNGGASAVRTTYENEEVKKIIYAPTAVFLKSNEILKLRKNGDPTGLGIPETYVNAINPLTNDTKVTSIPKPTFPEQEWIVEKIILAVNSALIGDKTPKEALEWAQVEIEKELPQ